MTWQTADGIHFLQRLSDGIIKQHLAETLKICTLFFFKVLINYGGKAVLPFIDLSNNNHLAGLLGPMWWGG